eukprot:gene17857-18455_t
MASYGKTSSNFPKKWEEHTAFTKGDGVWVQGTVAEINFHTVTAKDRVERYIACYMDVKWAYVVEMDKYGAEVTLEEEDVAASPRKRDHAALAAIIAAPDGFQSAATAIKLHPTIPGRFEFWFDASSDARKLDISAELKISTIGDSFWEGGQVMEELAGLTQSKLPAKLEQDDMEGCDSDEW